MVEKELTQHSNSKKHVRQPPSVPFLWEERPGIPKKDWKPGSSSVTSVPKPPLKLVASVPFIWEEKPGKPLPSFSLPPPAKLISLPSPLVYSHSYNDIDNNYDKGGNGGDGDEQEGMFKTDIETFSFKTKDSFSSAPSLLANCIVSLTAISTAVPVDNILTQDDKSGQLETPSSSPPSETASSTSSYATGTSSLIGASFLECLFPLFPPSSGFLDKAGENNCQAPLQPESRQDDRESNSGVVARRPPTLGELIMMSRRRSNRRKAVQMKKQNLSMVKLEILLPLCLLCIWVISLL